MFKGFVVVSPEKAPVELRIGAVSLVCRLAVRDVLNCLFIECPF